MSTNAPALTSEDAEWARNFVALHKFLKDHPKSEDATLLLSTCRNAYLTVNALFADVQALLGGAAKSPLRAACELVRQESPEIPTIRRRFQEALRIIAQFDLKHAVWRDRHALKKSVDDRLLAFEDQNPLDAVLVKAVLSETHIVPTDEADGRSVELLKINLAEQRHLDHHFETLRKLRDILEACARLGISYTDQVTLPQMTLIQDNREEQAAPVDKTVVHWVDRLAELCDWTATKVGEELEVRIEPTYKRPSNAHPLAPTRITHSREVSAAPIATLVREALYFAHSTASSVFEPNVFESPMPSVFEIALPVPRPTLSGAEILPVVLKRVRCSSANRPSDYGKVALAHLAVPVAKLNGKDFAFNDISVVEQIEADFNKAVHAARSAGCLAVAFPEYSIPLRMRERLLQIANRNNLVLIGGFEGQWHEAKLRDEVFVAIPGEPHLYQQFKQSPSLEEQQPASFYRDGLLKLFANSPIGDFAVIACSDFIESATLNAWTLDGPLPDVIFVIARNPYDALYESLAITDSFRLYCFVAICNVHDDEQQATAKGTFIVAPLRASPVQHGDFVQVEGTFLTGISVHELPFAAIRARERGKPAYEFFAVPRSAKRS